AKNEDFSRYASSICARSTRRAVSLRERAIAVNFSISSSVIANSTACRHLAMLQLLVRSVQTRNPPRGRQFQDRSFHGIGRLVAVEAEGRGLQPVLAGRSADPIQKLAAELGLPAQIFDLSDAASSTAALADIAVVANCAGPFAATSRPMID